MELHQINQTTQRRGWFRFAWQFVLVGLLVMALGPTERSLAQSSGEGSGGGATSMELRVEPRISLSFKGGTAVQFIEAIREQSQETNIIVMPKVELVSVPSMKLQDVSVQSAVMLLDDFREQVDSGLVALDVDIIRHSTGRGAQPGGSSESPAPIYVVNAQISTGRVAQSAGVGAQVWTIQELLQSQLDSEQVIAAVETAIPLSSVTEPAVEVRFHEDTGIVIARGPYPTLELINNVLSELQRSAHIQQSAEQRERREAEQTRQMHERLEQLERIEIERAELMEEMQHYRMRITEMEVQRAALENELAQMRQMNAELRDQVNALQMALMEASQQRNMGEGRGGGGDTGGGG